MSDDKKRRATIIVAKLRNGGERMSDAPEHDGAEREMDDTDVYVDEIMHAIKSDDKDALKDALKAYVSHCIEEHESEDESEDSDEDSEMPEGSSEDEPEGY